jgi:hypothetical protein
MSDKDNGKKPSKQTTQYATGKKTTQLHTATSPWPLSLRQIKPKEKSSRSRRHLNTCILPGIIRSYGYRHSLFLSAPPRASLAEAEALAPPTAEAQTSTSTTYT